MISFYEESILRMLSSGHELISAKLSLGIPKPSDWLPALVTYFPKRADLLIIVILLSLLADFDRQFMQGISHFPFPKLQSEPKLNSLFLHMRKFKSRMIHTQPYDTCFVVMIAQFISDLHAQSDHESQYASIMVAQYKIQPYIPEHCFNTCIQRK